MKKMMVALVVVLLLAGTLSAQWGRIGFDGLSIPSVLVKDNTVYAIADTIFYKSENGGESWDSVGVLNNRFVHSIKSFDGMFFAVSSWLCAGFCGPIPCIFRSMDGGATWDAVYSNPYGASQIVQNQGNIFANASARLVMSTDNGLSWDKVVPDSSGPPKYQCLYVHDGVLYTSGYMKGIYKTLDNGVTWSLVSSDLPNIGTYEIFANSAYLFAASIGGVYRSMDEGVNWEPVNTGLPLDDVYAITGNDQYVCISYNEIIYVSRDNGNTWTNTSEGVQPMESVNVYGMAVLDDYLFVASNDGIWRYDLATATDIGPGPKVRNPVQSSLQQNYPNPFNPSTNITYSLNGPGIVKLYVYDVLGKEVAVLVDEYQSAGTYTVTLNAAQLPSGIYLYKLETGFLQIQKKMVLVK